MAVWRTNTRICPYKLFPLHFDTLLFWHSPSVVFLSLTVAVSVLGYLALTGVGKAVVLVVLAQLDRLGQHF